jgi:hypothetical protein
LKLVPVALEAIEGVHFWRAVLAAGDVAALL